MMRMLLTPRRRRMKALMTGWRKPRPVKTLAIRRQSTENLFLEQQRIRGAWVQEDQGDQDIRRQGSRGSGDQYSQDQRIRG